MTIQSILKENRLKEGIQDDHECSVVHFVVGVEMVLKESGEPVKEATRIDFRQSE